jgi:soluble lytic murein transglycosylase-like protein
MIPAPVIAAFLVAAVPIEHRFDAEIARAVARTRDVFPVPAKLVRAIIRQESSFNPRALSRVGARGLMQVMPANAGRLGLEADDLWDPAKNILAGVRLLAVLLDHYRGDVISALVAYNARARPLFEPLPRNRETPGYVLKVLANYERPDEPVRRMTTIAKKKKVKP